MPRAVTLYVDTISPYAWLGLMRAEAFAARHDVAWDVRPVVYGVLLDRNALVGPAESDAKRRYMVLDAAREAALHGFRFTGPPAHPYRSLEALRAIALYAGRDAFVAARALADAAWGAGRDLTDVAVLADALAEAGLDATDLAARIAAPDAKAAVRAATEQALDAGVFGVPTFVLDGELFWGHDRMDALGRRLGGEPAPDAGALERILARPRGIDRRRAPGRRSG